MARHPKRLPGEPNPEPNRDAVDDVARAGWMANGHGIGDYGIVRGVLAMLDWRKRRKNNRGGRPREPRNTLLGQ